MPSSTPDYSTFSGDDFSGEISWRVDEATTHRYFGEINQKHDAAEESEQRAIASKPNRIFPCSDPEVFLDGRVKYEEALALAHRFIAEGYLYPHDELTYRMNLGLCCKRPCNLECLRLVALGPEQHPFFVSFARDLRGNLEELKNNACAPLSAAAPPETAPGMNTGVEESERLRLRGNDFFKLSKYDASIRMYSHAMGALAPPGPGPGGGGGGGEGGNRHLILSNRSAAWLMLGDVPRAMDDAHAAVAAGPEDWPKGHYRVAEAHVRHGRHEQAIASYQRSIALSPDGKDPAIEKKIEKSRKILEDRRGKNEGSGSGESNGPGGYLQEAIIFKQWAMQPMGRLDRLLAKTLRDAEMGAGGASEAAAAAAAAAAATVFKPGSKITDMYAAHRDWHDGMKIALMYRAVGAMSMSSKNGGRQGGVEVHVPRMSIGIEGFRLLSNAVLVDRAACVTMGMYIDGEILQFQSTLNAIQGMMAIFQHDSTLMFESNVSDDEIRASLRGKKEPGYGRGGRGGDDDPKVVRAVLQKAEMTIRMALVTSYVATMTAQVAHPGVPKGFTHPGRMARQAAECAIAWWLATKDRLLSLLSGDEESSAEVGVGVERREAVRRWEGFHRAKREAARWGLPHLASLMAQDHIIALRFEGMMEALDRFHVVGPGGGPLPNPPPTRPGQPPQRSSFDSPDDEQGVSEILCSIVELTNQLLEAEGEGEDAPKFFDPCLPYQKRAWACYELGLHAEAAESYRISTMVAIEGDTRIRDRGEKNGAKNEDVVAEEIYEQGNALGICAGEESAVMRAMQEQVEEEENQGGGGGGGVHVVQFDMGGGGGGGGGGSRSDDAMDDEEVEEEGGVWTASGTNPSAKKSEELQKTVGVVRESATVAIGRLRELYAKGEASEAARMGVWPPVRTQAKTMLKKVLDSFANKPEEFGVTREVYVKISTGKQVDGTEPAMGIAIDLQCDEEPDIAGLPNLGPVHTVGAAPDARAGLVVPRPAHGGLPRDGWHMP